MRKKLNAVQLLDARRDARYEMEKRIRHYNDEVDNICLKSPEDNHDAIVKRRTAMEDAALEYARLIRACRKKGM